MIDYLEQGCTINGAYYAAELRRLRQEIARNDSRCCAFAEQSACSHVASYHDKVQVGNDQEKAQTEKDSHSKNRGGKKTKLTIRYLYHENIS